MQAERTWHKFCLHHARPKMLELKKFATLFGRVHAMLNGCGFDKFWHHGLWAKVTNTATLWENNLVTPTQRVLFAIFGKVMKSIISLPNKFSKLSFKTNQDKFKAKMKN